MAHRWVFGIVFNLVILLNKDYGNRYEEESIAQETSFSSTGLALAQNWQGGTWCEEVAGDFSYAAFPSLQRHSFLCRIVQAMATSTASGWLCGNCRKMRSPNAWFCDLCGGSWEDCAVQTASQSNAGWVSPRSRRGGQAQSYVQDWQWPQQPWIQSQDAQARQPSPRTRQGGYGQGRKTKRGKKAKPSAPEQPGATAFVGQPPLPPPTTPPPGSGTASQQLVSPPMLAISSAPKAPVLAPPSEEAIKLRSIMQKLKKHQDQGMELPDDVQNDLKDIYVKEAKTQRKTMHLAVNAMDDARQAYDNAVQARSQLHSQWKGFLAESLKLWQGHTANFQAQEAQLTASIQQAKEAFVQARDAMNEAKIEAANMVPVDAKSPVTVSDDEEIRDLKDVPMVAAERIAAGLTNLVATMSALHHQTEELVQEEQRAKRPRVQAEQAAEVAPGTTPAASVSSQNAPSFGAPGGQ